MKNKSYTQCICETACVFYRPGKEELLCAGYRYLTCTYSVDKLKELTRQISMNSHMPEGVERYKNQDMETLLCEHCDFRIDGCDFADNCSGPPCGGYLIVLRLVQDQKAPAVKYRSGK